MAAEFKSFYKTVAGNEGNKCFYPTRLDPYGCGCSHDCKYCYAKSLLDFRKLWRPDDPSVVDISKVERKLDNLLKKEELKPGDILRIGGMTDGFQPIELQHRATYNVIKALNQRNLGYLIVTKSDIVADDEYIEIMNPDLAHIQITVTNTDDDMAAQYEVATPPSQRMEAIGKLYDNGFDVALRLSPFIPAFIDLDRLAEVNCDKITVEFLRVNTWIQKWFGDYINIEDYPIKEGGYRHMTLDTKKYWLDQIRGFEQITVCEDESEAYEYWKNNFNPNPNDCCNLRIATQTAE